MLSGSGKVADEAESADDSVNHDDLTNICGLKRLRHSSLVVSYVAGAELDSGKQTE